MSRVDADPPQNVPPRRDTALFMIEEIRQLIQQQQQLTDTLGRVAAALLALADAIATPMEGQQQEEGSSSSSSSSSAEAGYRYMDEPEHPRPRPPGF